MCSLNRNEKSECEYQTNLIIQHYFSLTLVCLLIRLLCGFISDAQKLSLQRECDHAAAEACNQF